MDSKKMSIITLCVIFLLIFILGIRGCTNKTPSDTVSQLPPVKESGGNVEVSSQNKDNEPVTIPMDFGNGVYYLPCLINDVPMKFVFDTGAAAVTISLTEALFLFKHNKISEDDIIGEEYYQMANGTIEEGTILNLQSVSVGGRVVRNVKASVMHNMDAPLLLGQSFLSNFGTVTIDYENNCLILE